MSVLRRFALVLNVQPGEISSLLFLFTLYFLWAAAFSLTKATAYALFVNTFSVSNLPYSYLLIGVVVSALTFFMLLLIERIPSSRLFVLIYVGLFVVTLLFRVGLNTNASATVIFLLPLWDFALTFLATSSLSSLFGQRYDVHHGRVRRRAGRAFRR